MKSLVLVTCLLAAMTMVHGENESILKRYLNYLKPHLTPCSEEYNVSEDELRKIEGLGKDVDVYKLGCLRACVMKRLEALKDHTIDMAPIDKMIEVVHAGDDAEIAKVKKIGADCAAEVANETEDCTLGMNYTECYIEKLFVDE